MPGGLGLRAVLVGPNPNRGQARQNGYAAGRTAIVGVDDLDRVLERR